MIIGKKIANEEEEEGKKINITKVYIYICHHVKNARGINQWISLFSFVGYLHPGFPGFAAAAAYGRAGFPPLAPGFITYPTGMELLHLTSWYPEAHLGF